MAKTKNLKNPVVFFDFDNTITTFDVLDDMLARFSRNDNWIKLEEQWKKVTTAKLPETTELLTSSRRTG